MAKYEIRLSEYCGPSLSIYFEVWTIHSLIGYSFLRSTISFLISISAAYLQITHMEMIKGIQGHGYYDELVVPIIENTAQERELTESLAAAVWSF